MEKEKGKSKGMPGWLKVIIVIIVILICLVGCMSSCGKAVDDAVKETVGAYEDQNGKKSFKVGETFENKYLKIKYESSNLDFKDYNKYATVKDDYKVVEFKFVAENISDENQSFSYVDFDCYADNQKMQQFYLTDDSGVDSGGTISKGKKSNVPIYCEVPKDSEKVTVEYKPLLADNNYEFIAE